MNRIPRCILLRAPTLSSPTQGAQQGFLVAPYSSFASPLPPSAPSSSQYPTSFVRGFASTSAAAASEAPRGPFDSFNPAEVPLFDKIQAHPEVLIAIQRLSKLTQEKTGVNLAGGDRPTVPMMLKLAQDEELKEAAGNLMRALKAAGIDIDPRQAFSALKTIGEGFDGLNLDDINPDGKKGDEEK